MVRIAAREGVHSLKEAIEQYKNKNGYSQLPAGKWG
jgi:hypothetical protein